MRANLSGANLRGVKLVGSDLTEANLTNADLTFAWFIRANFIRANLRGATLQTIVTSTAMDNAQAEAATFAGADLSDANITVHFSFYNMRRANHYSDLPKETAMILYAALDVDFSGAKISHTIFESAIMTDVKGLDQPLKSGN